MATKGKAGDHQRQRIAGLLLDDLAIGMPTDRAPTPLWRSKKDEP